MIQAAHVILYSTDAESDRAFFRDVLGFEHVDVGGGWLIFALPPAKVAVHPTQADSKHELYLVCADIGQLVETLGAKGVVCSDVTDEGWGLLTQVTLPGGGRLGIYEARHALVHG